jgi:hypothetical protein
VWLAPATTAADICCIPFWKLMDILDPFRGA